MNSPIGLQQKLNSKTQKEIILIADPRILSVPIQESAEVMVDLITQQDIIYGPSPEIPNNTDYTKMRKTVYEKLKHAQALLPHGLKLCLYEGYRSLSLQKMLFETHLSHLQIAHPDWSAEQIFKETLKLVSPITNLDGSKNVPPHSTGGAIDVYLLDKNNDLVDMGLHPKDWMLDLDNSISVTHSHVISKEAQQNRNIMTNVLSTVGFVNYPTEYWHWSYGDRYWAYHTKNTQAIYGSI